MKSLFFISLLLAASMSVSCNNSDSGKEEVKNQTSQAMFDVTLLDSHKTPDGVIFLSVQPSGVCSRQIDISVKDGIIMSVKYTGGCHGNTQGISKLVEGMPVKDAISKLEGINCAGRGTSCPDQLARALKLLKL